MRFKQLLSELATFSRSARAQRWLKLASPIFLVAIGALLAYQLTRIGWGETSRSIPTSPLFYLLFAVYYLTLPGSESFLYSRLWPCGFWRLLPRACLKHVCNQDVFELSGEVYFYVWSTKRLGLNPGQALRTIKDVTILSAIVGYVVMLGLPPLCLWLGLLGPAQGLTPRDTLLIGYGAPVALCGIAAVVIGLRRALFFLAGPALLEVTGVHLARFLFMNAVIVAQWMVVMSEQPLRAWCTLLVVSNAVGRLPSFLSNNMVFAAAGIGISASLGLPPATVAGMLLANTMLDKLLNLTMVLGTTLAGRYYTETLKTIVESGSPSSNSDLRQVA
jgi:hypothetical protein